MSLYTIILIFFFFFMVGIIGGVVAFVMWLDKKIDTKDRLGASAYRKKKNKTHEDKSENE